ncbi:dihydrofolate reductase family protein [Paenibacillus cymbidii]|uniref:dihydrofolate reductase family protein n=1 Tax=Paenibacillus cymbidii TaxID=1639034 RepID=UPI0010801675|nr:dihydrofolate reductase family protein [Paenibacillus cymbidii]
MCRIKMLNRVSLDGYFAGADEASMGMDWFIHDPEVDAAAHTMGGRMEMLLLGGETFRLFERYWTPFLQDPHAPKHLKATAEELTAMTKLVFSTTLPSSDWANTRIHRGNLPETVREWKQRFRSDILVLGSGSIVQQLALENLIDEYIFIVTPVVVGGGKRLFPDGTRFELQLKAAQSFDSGNILLHYERKKGN